MGAPRANTFEGGTAEADVSTANSGGTSGDAVNAVSRSVATTIKYEGTTPLLGSVSMRIVYGAGAAGFVQWNFSPTATGTRTVWRWYMRFKAGDTHTNVDLFNVRHAGGHTARLWLDGSARIQVADSTSAVIATASSAVPTDTLIRIEVATTVGTTTSNGTIEVAYFLGHSMTPIETIISSSTRNLNTAAITNCRLGSASYVATSRTHWFDDFAVQELESGWIGPSVTPSEARDGNGTIVPSGQAATSAGLTGQAILTAATSGRAVVATAQGGSVAVSGAASLDGVRYPRAAQAGIVLGGTAAVAVRIASDGPAVAVISAVASSDVRTDRGATGVIAIGGAADASVLLARSAPGTFVASGNATMAVSTTASGIVTIAGSGLIASSTVTTGIGSVSVSGSAISTVREARGGDASASLGASATARARVSRTGGASLTLAGEAETLTTFFRAANGRLDVVASSQDSILYARSADGSIVLDGVGLVSSGEDCLPDLILTPSGVTWLLSGAPMPLILTQTGVAITLEPRGNPLVMEDACIR